MNYPELLYKNCDLSLKFIRRKDLDKGIRLYIAYMMMMNNGWGVVTHLSKRFFISRTFAYMLMKQLNTATDICFGCEVTEQSKKEVKIELKNEALKQILLFRLEGKCSILSISDILKTNGIENNSVGTISQNLNRIGRYLPNTLRNNGDEILCVYLAADELYSHSTPILISVDAISTAIIKIELAESRKTDDWVSHFKEIKGNGVDVVMLVSDEGQGICAATGAAFPEKKRQPDTFHAVSHRLGIWRSRLLSAAYTAIKEEYHRFEMFESAKTDVCIKKRMDAYFTAQAKAKQAVMLHDNFTFLYYCIIEHLQVFDNEGNLRDRKCAEENISIALDYMIGLPIDKMKKEINTIYNLLDNLLEYLDTAKEVVMKIGEKGIPGYIVQAFSLAWQYERNATKAKSADRKRYYKNKKTELISTMKMVLGTGFKLTRTNIFTELDKIIQSSAVVENINSIVRTFLNTSKNHINQELLNLIMFYHNHRRYNAGKRKGKTPMEILTGKKQEKDWLDMLLEIDKEQKALALALAA